MCDVNEDTNQRPKEAEVTLCVMWSIVWLTEACAGLALQSVSKRKEPAPVQSGNLNLATIWNRISWL